MKITAGRAVRRDLFVVQGQKCVRVFLEWDIVGHSGTFAVLQGGGFTTESRRARRGDGAGARGEVVAICYFL